VPRLIRGAFHPPSQSILLKEPLKRRTSRATCSPFGSIGSNLQPPIDTTIDTRRSLPTASRPASCLPGEVVSSARRPGPILPSDLSWRRWAPKSKGIWVHVPLCILVVLDDVLSSAWPPVGGRIIQLVSHGPVASQALLEHPCKNRYPAVNIVKDANFGLAMVSAMEAAGVLDQGSLPGDGQGQEQSVQPGVVEPLADEAPRSQKDPLLRVGDLRELLCRPPACLRACSPFENQDIPRSPSKALGEELKIVSPLCEQHRRPALHRHNPRT